MKKALLFTCLTSLMIAGLTGCGKDDDNRIVIGILSPNHPALNAAADGFMAGLKDNGFDSDKVRFIRSTPNKEGSDLNSLAKDLISRCDLTLGVATDPSKALQAASLEKGITNPLLFTAVTDPVHEGLVPSLEVGTGFITGTSDINPVKEQIQLMKEIKTINKVGILYTSSESNSQVQADMAIAEIERQNWTAVVRTATKDATTITAAVGALISENVDAIYIPTDNNIAQNTNAVKAAVQNTGILVVCGEESMLKGCGSATLSIDYTELGHMTGEMTAQILKGEKEPSEIPVGLITELDRFQKLISSSNAVAAGVTLPQSIIDTSTDVGPINA